MLANAVIGAVPGHPILKEIVSKCIVILLLIQLQLNFFINNPSHPGEPTWIKTGPGFWTEFTLKFNAAHYNFGVYPYYSFVPYHHRGKLPRRMMLN
jgi:hypothetical protein